METIRDEVSLKELVGTEVFLKGERKRIYGVYSPWKDLLSIGGGGLEDLEARLLIKSNGSNSFKITLYSINAWEGRGGSMYTLTDELKELVGGYYCWEKISEFKLSEVDRLINQIRKEIWGTKNIKGF